MNDQLTGQLLDGKYLVQQKLGEGGMGAVYLGEHAAMGKKVAVKMLHSFFVSNEEVVKRFFREARAAAAINHRNIIDVIDMGVTPSGEPYLVMEYLQGRDIESIIKENKRLDLATACAILEPTLAAIGAAHRKGVVHRDLKPENIFVNKSSDEEAEIKLIDFGISKFQDTAATKLTVEGTTMGTPAYMSPEQARGAKDLNHTTDIYAVGVILYEMLSGATPYEGETFNELFANILTTEPRHPSQVCDDFPMEAWPVIEKAIAKDPKDRYQSSDELMVAIDGLCDTHARSASFASMAAQITTTETASGDLGPAVTDDNGMAAPDILSDIVRQSTQHAGGATVMAAPLGEAAEHTMLASAGTIPKDAIAADPPTPLARAREALLENPNKLYYRMGLGAVLSLFLALSVGLCSDDGGVEIEVLNPPKNATIFYNDSIVTENPFRVERGETMVPLRVEVRGRTRMNVSITPSEDQEITYTPVQRKGAIQVKKTETEEEPVASEDNQPKPTSSRRNSRQKKSSEPAKSSEEAGAEGESGSRRKPFKRLGGRIRNAFN